MYKIYYILLFSLLLINKISLAENDENSQGSGSGSTDDDEDVRCQMKNDADCTSDGDYKPVQCAKDYCWCVSDNGKMIAKTKKKTEKSKMKCDNDEESSGDNTEKPQITLCDRNKFQCTPNGYYEEIQCSDKKCWCVDEETGKTISKTFSKSDKNDENVCSSGSGDSMTKKPIEKTTRSPNEIDDPNDSIDEEKEDNIIPSIEITHSRSIMTSSIIAKPGMLAGLICGAVVGLLCAVLLVMFIVYRMRKKDEGSYALDESKRGLTSSNTAYTKATKDKEYFA